MAGSAYNEASWSASIRLTRGFVRGGAEVPRGATAPHKAFSAGDLPMTDKNRPSRSGRVSQ